MRGDCCFPETHCYSRDCSASHLTRAVIKVTEMGGAFSNVLDIQKSVADELHRNLIVQKETIEGIYAASKVTGVGNAAMGKKASGDALDTAQLITALKYEGNRSLDVLSSNNCLSAS